MEAVEEKEAEGERRHKRMIKKNRRISRSKKMEEEGRLLMGEGTAEVRVEVPTAKEELQEEAKTKENDQEKMKVEEG